MKYQPPPLSSPAYLTHFKDDSGKSFFAYQTDGTVDSLDTTSATWLSFSGGGPFIGSNLISGFNTDGYYDIIFKDGLNPEEYTIEFWCKPQQYNQGCLMSTCALDSETNLYSGFEIWDQGPTSVFRFNIANQSDSAVGGGMENLDKVDGTWIHCALVKDKTGIYGALNGKLVLLNSDNTQNGWQKLLRIGRQIRGVNYCKSFLSEIRISYKNTLDNFDTTNLTYSVPTEQFTDDGPIYYPTF